MIEAVHLTKRFGRKTALEQLSARIPQGCIYGLVGPNGSGKSTLMRLMCGVYRPDEGQILVDGEETYETLRAKARVFYLPDDLYFLPKSTVEEMARFYEASTPPSTGRHTGGSAASFPSTPRPGSAPSAKGCAARRRCCWP